MCPFVSISVIPSYGDHLATLSWNVTPEFSEARFFVYRSDDGVTNWKLLTPQGLTNTTLYCDCDLVVENQLDRVHYKVTATKDGKRYDSHSIGFFDDLTRREYGTVRKILSMEHKRMDAGKNGISVLLFKRKRYGELCSCVDPDTHQSLGSSKCTKCYGVKYVGGYHCPVNIFMEQLKRSPRQLKANEEGLGANDQIVMQIRALSYPELTSGDVIVNTSTDERWFVEVVSETHYFKGVIPIVSDSQVTLIRRDHIVYKLKPPTSNN